VREGKGEPSRHSRARVGGGGEEKKGRISSRESNEKKTTKPVKGGRGPPDYAISKGSGEKEKKNEEKKRP